MIFSLGVNPVVGKEKAPDFTLVDIDQNQFSLSYYLGKVVLLNFFATSCDDCISQMDPLKSLYDKYWPDLEILSISVDPDHDTVQVLQNFVRQFEIEWKVTEIEWKVARDTANVADKYGVEIEGLPHLVVVDAEGYKAYEHVGLTEEVTLSSEIDSLLLETGNGNSNGNSNDGSNSRQAGLPYTLIAIIGGAVLVFLVVGIVVAGQLLEWSKPSKKRRSRKHKS